MNTSTPFTQGATGPLGAITDLSQPSNKNETGTRTMLRVTTGANYVAPAVVRVSVDANLTGPTVTGEAFSIFGAVNSTFGGTGVPVYSPFSTYDIPGSFLKPGVDGEFYIPLDVPGGSTWADVTAGTITTNIIK